MGASLGEGCRRDLEPPSGVGTKISFPTGELRVGDRNSESSTRSGGIIVSDGFLREEPTGEPGVAEGTDPIDETEEIEGPIEGVTGRGSPARMRAAKANLLSGKSRAGITSAISGRSRIAVSSEKTRV
jgi:hypothetical protein